MSISQLTKNRTATPKMKQKLTDFVHFVIHVGRYTGTDALDGTGRASERLLSDLCLGRARNCGVKIKDKRSKS